MYAVLNATGQPLVLVYFVLLIVLGGFFIVNDLFLAVRRRGLLTERSLAVAAT
jgi:hypothetical protein